MKTYLINYKDGSGKVLQQELKARNSAEALLNSRTFCRTAGYKFLCLVAV